MSSTRLNGAQKIKNRGNESDSGLLEGAPLMSFPSAMLRINSRLRMSGGLATDFVDALIEFHVANKDVYGLEKQFRWSVRLGDDAADLEPEEGYLLLQAVEFEGVADGLAVFLPGVGRVEAVGEGVPVAQLATSAAFWELMVGFVRCHGDRVRVASGCWEGGDVRERGRGGRQHPRVRGGPFPAHFWVFILYVVLFP